MAQVNGLPFRLVYSRYFYNPNVGKKIPLSNGVPLEILDRLKNLVDNVEFNIDFQHYHLMEYADRIAAQYGWEVLHLHHSNLLKYCRNYYGHDIFCAEEEVIDDGTNYFYPIEVQGSHNMLLPEGVKGKGLLGRGRIFTLKDCFTDRVLDLVRSGRVKILISCIHDPTPNGIFLTAIGTHLNKFGIKTSDIFYIGGNEIEDYMFPDTFASIGNKINVVSDILALYQTADLVGQFPRQGPLNYVSDICKPEDLDPNFIRPKKFLCFNRSLERPHRLAMAYYCQKFNWFDSGIFSFLNIRDENKSVDFVTNNLSNFITKSEIDTDIIQKFLDKLPIQWDTGYMTEQERWGFPTINTYNKDFYTNTYVHLISETLFNHNVNPFFSEKTFRPILNLQPFILIGNFKGLRKLQNLGFKTFHPFINENYDNEIRPVARMQMILKEINKLHHMSQLEIHDWYYSITDVLLHNLEVLKSYRNKNAVENIISTIIGKINDNTR